MRPICRHFQRPANGDQHTLKRALTDPTPVQRHRQCLFGRDSGLAPSFPPIAMTQKLTTQQIGNLFTATRTVLAEWTARLRADTRIGLSRKSDCISPRHGSARTLRPALPGMRRAHTAHRLRGKRNQLLCRMPNRRHHSRGSRPVAVAQVELAAFHRRAWLGPPTPIAPIP